MANPKASDVATELRKLADAIDKLGDAETIRPFVYFGHSDNRKECFIALAKVLPRPLMKVYEEGPYPDLKLQHNNDNLHITAAIPCSEVCEIVEPAQPARPAQYHCPSIFSTEEEDALGEF